MSKVFSNTHEAKRSAPEVARALAGTKQDRKFMDLTLELASKGEGMVSPNPMVGAVIVKCGRVIGKGYHKGFGCAHAEVEALKGKSFKDVVGSTMYVTLEPCVYFDGKKTGSCSELILSKGLARVFVAYKDPNLSVNGKGIELLRKNGVDVKVGLLDEEARALNEVYIKNMQTSLPFLGLKIASSLDGKIATAGKDSRWITGEESRRFVHELRQKYNAVMTTSETVISDDPHLGVRLKGAMSDPLRIVIDRSFRTDVGAKVYRDENVLVVAMESAASVKKKKFVNAGIDLLTIPDPFSLKKVINQLYKMGIGSILVEAGGRFAASLLKERLADKCFYFVAPKFIGLDGISAVDKLGISKASHALSLKNVVFRSLGHDILFEGNFDYKK